VADKVPVIAGEIGDNDCADNYINPPDLGTSGRATWSRDDLHDR
jgi:hypothetical protein